MERAVRILLVDDDESEYILTRELLSDIEDWSFELDWAATYDDGLDIIAHQQHDVYLIDYRLGPRYGLDLLREATLNGCSRPMILFSGLEDDNLHIEAMEAGAADFLVKGSGDALLLQRSIRDAVRHLRP